MIELIKRILMEEQMYKLMLQEVNQERSLQLNLQLYNLRLCKHQVLNKNWILLYQTDNKIRQQMELRVERNLKEILSFKIHQ